MIYRVAAYITAYEDVTAVEKCILSIRQQSYQVEKIFIVDNSQEKLNSPSLSQDNILVEHHPENLGISGGLKLAVSWSLGEKYDFLWTFDQDSEPINNALEELLISYQELRQKNLEIGIIAPQAIDVKSQVELCGLMFNQYRFHAPLDSQNTAPNFFKIYSENLYECDAVITSGSLINLLAAKQVELPNLDLFIDGVDFDYCCKFKNAGYKIVVNKKAILNHNFATYITKRINSQGIEGPIYSYSALRYYYLMRNHTWLESRLAYKYNSLHLCIGYRLSTLIKTSLQILRYEPSAKFLKVGACFRGTWEGFFGRLGKIW